MTYITITDADFRKEALESKLPVVVEFYTDRHGSCHIIGPAMKEMADKFRTQVKFCRINVDDHRRAAQEYGVQDIPTILFFKKGQIVDHITGVVPKAIIAEKFNDLLKP